MGLHFGDCTPRARPPRRGNCTIRAATRRRHAERKLLMVQNPHVAARHASKRFTHWPSAAHLCALSSRWSVIWVPRAVLGSAARGELQDLDTSAAISPLESAVLLPHGGIASLEPRHADAPWCHLDYDGGNCTIRAATRRRHAERKLLMVQNPQSTARLEDVGGSDGSRRWWQQDLTRLQNCTTRHRPTPRAARSEGATETG